MRRLAIAALLPFAACAPRPDQLLADGTRFGVGRTERSRSEGPWVLIGPAGRPLSAGTFHNGLATGIWKHFRPDGSLARVVRMQDGIPHGDSESYHADGSVESSGAFDRGLPTGPWLFRGTDGALDEVRTGRYERGRKIE